MSCYKCGHSHCHGSCIPNDCGCPIQLDFSCVLYHKRNNEVTELDGLGLSNGATLELVIETIDEKVKGLNVIDFDLPCLRESYVINTMKQFVEAVDTELCLIKDRLDALEV